jgi:hypothetical protein
MAISNVSREVLRLAAEDDARQYGSELRFQVLPLSLLILAFVLVAGMVFFRSDVWLLGASFIAGGFLVVSTLLYIASKRLPSHTKNANRGANTKHLGTGTLSTAAGAVALFAVTGHVGTSIGEYTVFIAQIGFALMVMGAFWLALTVRDMF